MVSKYLRRHIKRTNSGVFIINIYSTGALLLCFSLLLAAERSMHNALMLLIFYLCCDEYEKFYLGIFLLNFELLFLLYFIE